MDLNRRTLLKAGAAALAARTTRGADDDAGGEDVLGVVIHSFPNRVAHDRATGGAFPDPVAFLEHCRELGAGGIQVGLGALDPAGAADLRRRAESAGMFLEGIARLPRDRADLDRFDAEVRTAAEAGARVVRTVMLDGRRYEVFDSEAAFRRHAEQAYGRLALAEPVVARRGVRLAVENHKDWRADDLIALLRRLGSLHVGVCLDTGNSIALLEDAMAVVEALAPLAFTTHVKDMGVREYERGFLLAEVPFGTGYLDMPRVVRTIRRARPDIHINIEMITRDPLEVPCLAERYWTTFPDLPGRDLAHTLATVRAQGAGGPLPRVSDLPPGRRIAVEEQNVRLCLAFAREHLGLSARG